TGNERWRVYPNDNLYDPKVSGDDVVSDGQRLYVPVSQIDRGTPDATGLIAALDPATGREIWHSQDVGEITFGAGIRDFAVLSDGSIAFLVGLTTPRRVIVLDATTGQQRWEVGVQTAYTHLAAPDGRLVVADGTKTRAYDLAGHQQWQVTSAD